ncbi:MAG: hypothetical protein GY731_19305 [Gammaproteobacteria bacterium]|nr:hypothetical protein [Gammaproteobacteria bacterium]
MQGQFSRGVLNTDNLVTFLGNWWADHIQGMDRAFASHCRDKDELIKQALNQIDPTPEQDDQP